MALNNISIYCAEFPKRKHKHSEMGQQMQLFPPKLKDAGKSTELMYNCDKTVQVGHLKIH